MAMVAMAENDCPVRGMLYTKVLKKCETCENIDLDEILMVRIALDLLKFGVIFGLK